MGISFPIRPSYPIDVRPEPGSGISVRRQGTALYIGDGASDGSGGGGGSGDSEGTAATAVGAYRVLASLSGSLNLASADTSAHFGKVVGLSVATASAGQSVSYATGRAIGTPSFSFVEGPIYLGFNGALTQTYPTKAAGYVFAQQVAVATAPASIVVGIQPPVLLA